MNSTDNLKKQRDLADELNRLALVDDEELTNDQYFRKVAAVGMKLGSLVQEMDAWLTAGGGMPEPWRAQQNEMAKAVVQAAREIRRLEKLLNIEKAERARLEQKDAMREGPGPLSHWDED
jgi:hypothetical protein